MCLQVRSCFGTWKTASNVRSPCLEKCLEKVRKNLSTQKSTIFHFHNLTFSIRYLGYNAHLIVRSIVYSFIFLLALSLDFPWIEWWWKLVILWLLPHPPHFNLCYKRSVADWGISAIDLCDRSWISIMNSPTSLPEPGVRLLTFQTKLNNWSQVGTVHRSKPIGRVCYPLISLLSLCQCHLSTPHPSETFRGTSDISITEIEINNWIN